MRALRACLAAAALLGAPAGAGAETHDESLDARFEVEVDFADVVRRRLAAPEDFARTYIVAHELWHNAMHQSSLRASEGRRALAAHPPTPHDG